MDAEVDISDVIQQSRRQVPTTFLSQVERLFGNRGSRTEGQDARAGDQWAVPEMWVSPSVGNNSRKNVSGTKRKAVSTLANSQESCSRLPAVK